MKTFILALSVSLLAGCGDEWACKTEGRSMYSISESGKLGSADKGCSCDEMRAFELREFGSVDETALKDDFEC